MRKFNKVIPVVYLILLVLNNILFTCATQRPPPSRKTPLKNTKPADDDDVEMDKIPIGKFQIAMSLAPVTATVIGDGQSS